MARGRALPMLRMRGLLLLFSLGAALCPLLYANAQPSARNTSAISAAGMGSADLSYTTRSPDNTFQSPDDTTQSPDNTTRSPDQQPDATSSPSPVITLLQLEGAVTPPMADYLMREIKAASASQAIILTLDTPGGLVDSTKSIIKAMLASPVPVISFVSPAGARSASAGLYIMYAAHVSAMAPATNAGAATPVSLGNGGEEKPPDNKQPADTPEAAPKEEENGNNAFERFLRERPVPNNDEAMRAKIVNDMAAYIRALAEESGRNADWAERAVRDGVSASARTLLAENAIDLIALDIPDLLRQIDGRSVTTKAGTTRLETRAAVLKPIEPTLKERILQFLANPSVALIFLSLATTGIIIEMWNPGSIFPGTLGVTSFLLGAYGMQLLPFAWLGLTLMGLGAILILIEAFTPTFGLAGLSGGGLFAVGAYFLFPGDLRVGLLDLSLIILPLFIILALVVFVVVQNRKKPAYSSDGQQARRTARVIDWDATMQTGHVMVAGERWRAVCDKALRPGEKALIQSEQDLVLSLRPLAGADKSEA